MNSNWRAYFVSRLNEEQKRSLLEVQISPWRTLFSNIFWKNKLLNITSSITDKLFHLPFVTYMGYDIRVIVCENGGTLADISK